MDSSQPLVDMLTQDSEADLEVLTQAPIPDSGSSRGRGGNYNHNEDIQLCWSWMANTIMRTRLLSLIEMLPSLKKGRMASKGNAFGFKNASRR